MLRNAAVDPTRERPDEWSVEPRGAALARAPDLGRAFFARLAAAYPRVDRGLVFLRWSGQADHVYAVFDGDPGFGVQIDPDLDYIIVWDADAQGEYAEWHPGDDPVAAALAHVAGALGARPPG